MRSIKTLAVAFILATVTNKSFARPHDVSSNQTLQDERTLNQFGEDFERQWQGYRLVRRGGDVARPLCRALCSSCNGGACGPCSPSRKPKLVKKVLPSLPEFVANEKLTKKTLTVLDPEQPDTISAYVLNQFSGTGVTLLEFDTSGLDLSTSLVKNLRRRPASVTIGVTNLCGCTTLVIVSSKAVYVAHFFETSSFSPLEDADITPEQAFQKNVIDFLDNGRDSYTSLVTNKHLFSTVDGNVMSFIISPAAAPVPPTDDDMEVDVIEPEEYLDTFQYSSRIDDLDQYLQRTLPGTVVRRIRYDPLNGGSQAGLNALNTGFRGKILFEYDVAGFEGSQGNSAGARLISEKYIVDTFKWSQGAMIADGLTKRIFDTADENQLLCGNQTYYEHEATCYSGILCPIIDGMKNLLCGSECYHPGTHVCSTSELIRIKRDEDPTSSSITELVWDQSTVLLETTTSAVTITGVPVILQSNGVVINNQKFTLPAGQTNIVVVAGGLTLTIEQVPATTQTTTPPGTSAASPTPTPTPSSTSFTLTQTPPTTMAAVAPSSVFSWPTVITTTITTTDANGIETHTVTGTNSSGIIVPMVTLSPAAASSSAAALAAELAVVSAAVAAFAADTAATAAGTAAVGAIHDAQSIADAFGLGLGTAASLCIIFCEAAADAALALGSLDTTVGGIIAGTGAAGDIAGLSGLLGGLAAAAGSLADESTPHSGSQSAESTPTSTSTSSCSTITVTDFEILCGTAVFDGYISTTVCSTVSTNYITACSATATTSTTYKAAFCPISTAEPRTPVQVVLDGEDIITETIFCGDPIPCSNCTGTYANGMGTCSVDGSGLGCACTPDSQTSGFTCPTAASCDGNNCTGTFNLADGKAYCTNYAAGCECIETATTCGAQAPCESNDCAGAFNMTDGKAYCTNHFAGCQCQSTPTTCGQSASCDGYNCQGAFNMNDGKAHCTNFFEGCQCTPTANTCGAKGSCDSNYCNGQFNMSDGKSYCTNHFSGCECQATTNTCGQSASCDGYNCQGAFNMDDGKAYCTNFFEGCQCTPTANTCGPQGSCDNNDCGGAFNMADGKAYCTNHFAGCECTPTGNTCGAWGSCDDNNCNGAFDMDKGNAYCTNFFQGCQCWPTATTCGAHGSCDDNYCNGAWNNGVAYCTGHFAGCQCNPTANTCGAHASCDDDGCNGAFDYDGVAYCTGNYAGCQCNPTSNTCGARQRCKNNGCAGSVDDHSSQYATCKGKYAGCSCIATAYTIGYCMELQSCSFGTCAGNVPAGSNFGICSAGRYLGCGCLKPNSNTGVSAQLPPNKPCYEIPGCAMSPGNQGPVTCKIAECQFIDGVDSNGHEMGVDCSCVCSNGNRWDTHSYASPGSDCTPYGDDLGEDTLDILCSLFWWLDLFPGIC